MRRHLITGILLPLALLAAQLNNAKGVDPRKTAPSPTAPSTAIDPFAIPPTTTPGHAPATNPTPAPAPTLNVAPTPTQPQPATPDPVQPGIRTRTAPTSTGDPAAATGGNVTSQLLSHSDRRPPRWRLGVYSQDTDTGVQINRVVADTPADRAGLEAGDVIVAVNGFQVGIVNGDHYDCGYEFENRADTDGNVMLLVQDHRTHGLVNLPLKLESRMESVSGSIAFSDPVSFPPDTQVKVELQELVRQDAPVVKLAETTISDIRQIPIPFQIEYDPLDIDPRRTYRVNATITSGNRTLYTTTQQYPVITADHGKNVTVAVARTPQTPGSADSQREELESQIVAWYRKYLGRDPQDYEMPQWTNLVTQRGRSMQDVQAQLLARDEVYNLCDRDKRQYIAFLYQQITGKTPTQEQIEYWISKFNQTTLRSDLTNEFLTAKGNLH